MKQWQKLQTMMQEIFMVKFNLYSDQKDFPFSSQRRESKFIYEWLHYANPWQQNPYSYIW